MPNNQKLEKNEDFYLPSEGITSSYEEITYSSDGIVDSSDEMSIFIGQNPFVIETATGIFFDLSNPDAEMVNLEDMAISLSQTTRFSGQIKRKFKILPSVDLHCVLVENILCGQMDSAWQNSFFGVILRLHGLLHDAHEAYIGDIATPLKALIGKERLKAISDPIDAAIFESIGIRHPEPDEILKIKQADNLALRVESSLYLTSRGAWAGNPADNEVLAYQGLLLQYLNGEKTFDWMSSVEDLRYELSDMKLTGCLGA